MFDISRFLQCFPTLRFAAVDRSFLRVAWPCARNHDESDGSERIAGKPRVAGKRGWKGLQCVPWFSEDEGKAKGRTDFCRDFRRNTFQKSMSMTSMLILYKKPGFKNGNGWKWCVLSYCCNLRYWHHLKIGIGLLPIIMAEWKSPI